MRSPTGGFYRPTNLMFSFTYNGPRKLRPSQQKEEGNEPCGPLCIVVIGPSPYYTRHLLPLHYTEKKKKNPLRSKKKWITVVTAEL